MKRELPDELKFLTNRKAAQKPFDAPMNGKLCVITGATSGVGLETARSLASHGAHLVLIARSEGESRAGQSGNPVQVGCRGRFDLR